MASKAASIMFCGVCQEKMNWQEKKPVILPACGHSFCQQCLIHINEVEGRIVCPICRICHRGQSPENLPVNWLLLKMLDDEEDESSAQKTTKNAREAPYSTAQSSKDLSESLKASKAEESIIYEDRNNSDNEPPSKFWKKAGIAAGSVIGGVGLVAAAPVVLTGVGFTSAGIAAGSWATGMMSSAAIANGGGVAAGSLVAVLQSAGAAGIGATATGIIGATGAGIGGGVAYVADKLFGRASNNEDNSQISETKNKDNADDPENEAAGED